MIGKKSKILLIILIFVLTFNFCSPTVMAGEGMVGIELNNPSSTPGAGKDVGSVGAAGVLSGVLDFAGGLVFYIPKMIAYYFGKALLLLADGVAGEGKDVTPETILFNEIPVTNINFFDQNSGAEVPFVKQLKTSIASWYYVMRTIAIVASLCVLLYIAIRMATSTVASDKAEYKRMLTDWLVGFALIFVLHYIIILVINGNNLIVETLKEAMGSGNGSQLTNYVELMENQVVKVSEFSHAMGAIIVYLILVVITIAFLLMYIKRMIVVAFLIIIAPLITITYSIDKVGDNKSQALDTWLKEFVWTVLIQPFHCVIYVVFVSVSLDSLSEGSLSSSVLAIMCMIFILQAEDIIKKIFGIQADNIGKMSGSFAMAAGGALVASKFAKNTGKAAAVKGGKAVSSIASKMPKTQDGKGVGIGETREGSPSMTQRIANTIASPKVQASMKKLNDFMDNNKFGPAMKTTGRVLGSYAKASYTTGTTMAGAAMSLPTAKGLGDVVEGGLAGYAAGKTVKWAAKKATVDVIESGRTRNAVNNLNESFKQMQEQNKFTNAEMKEKAKAYLKLDLDSETAKTQLSEVERLFAYNLQVMKHQLEKVGDDAGYDSVMSKIKFKNMEAEGNNQANNQTNSNINNA